ncbi:HD domain-containing protein [Actinomadura sp. DC4]|uniref:HD domain-containing protein n=1 Tax=Actinomadura sp. DC4 TaxID=3055069 RepID=UPI0025AEE22E|nr:HD domain-containing protein [Actinomadura sp. DC4]MDN3353768.1 HD domain-containing protein [Actinomadura sp. DC4]
MTSAGQTRMTDPDDRASIDRFRAGVIRETTLFARKELGVEESTGHDWWHVDRVRMVALNIAECEGADPYIVELAALLHDIEDYKFSGSDEAGPRAAAEWLISLGVEDEVTKEVAGIIRWMSFRGAKVEEVPLSLEGECVQDADRLDAIGAIGIARVFAYGGHVKRPIHNPDMAPDLHTSAESYVTSKGTSINHFHEKLLLLKERMKTPTGRRYADSRHERLVEFLRDFDAEWTGAK